MTHIKNVLAIWTTAPVLIFCASTAWAEAQWWDWEYQGDVPLTDAHPALWLTDHPPLSDFTDLDGREELSYWQGVFVRRPTTTSDEWGNIVDCPDCVNGKKLFLKSDIRWDGLLIRETDSTREGWTKSQGFWPTAADEGCPGQVDTSPFPHFGEAGWHIPASGIGNPGCFAGGATVEVRYRWTCNLAECPDDGETSGVMPFAYPASGKNPVVMKYDSTRGDHLQFNRGFAGEWPEVDLGDDWVVVRMVFGSSWDGLDYYIHDDGSLEPGTSTNRGADWQDASGNNQFGRNELEKVIIYPNAWDAPGQDNKGFKGGDTASVDTMFLVGGGSADFELDYIRWAFNKKVAPVPIPEPTMLLLFGAAMPLLLRRRRN